MERWKINLYTLWFSQVLSLTSFGFGIPFLAFYIQELGITDPNQLKIYTGILNAAPAITMGIMAPIWGWLSDKYGKKLMLLRSMFFGFVILAGMGFAQTPGQLLALRLLQGMFTGTMTASAALIASITPENKLSYSLGLLSSSNFLGMSIGPAVGGIIAEYLGYRRSFFIGAAIMLLDVILVLYVVQSDKKNGIQKTAAKASGFSGIKSIFTISITIMLSVLLMLRISRTVCGPYIPLFVQETLATLEGAAGTTGIINAVSGLMTALAGFTLSRFGDRSDRRKFLMVLISLGVVSSIPLSFISNLWIFTIVFGITSIFSGGIEPTLMSITAEQTPPDKRGTLFGVQALVSSIGWAISPLIGSIVSIKMSLNAVFVTMPLFLIFALIPVYMLKNRINNVEVTEQAN